LYCGRFEDGHKWRSSTAPRSGVSVAECLSERIRLPPLLGVGRMELERPRRGSGTVQGSAMLSSPPTQRARLVVGRRNIYSVAAAARSPHGGGCGGSQFGERLTRQPTCLGRISGGTWRAHFPHDKVRSLSSESAECRPLGTFFDLLICDSARTGTHACTI